jgi:hypothetical protein
MTASTVLAKYLSDGKKRIDNKINDEFSWILQRTGHNGGLGGSVPLLDAENGGRKLSGNDNSPTMPASPSDSANRTGSKTCCFCWCCCCSCSWYHQLKFLTVTNYSD